MKIIATVDENNGMMFNKRRQSRDRAVTEKILSLTRGETLWVNKYTSALFEGADGLRVDENPLSRAGEGEYCFIENLPLSPYAEKIGEIILFKWNRRYPGDMFFDIDMKKWKKISGEEFPGHSHEKITMEVYER